MPNVVMYKKAVCPYCTKAAKLLASKGVTPDEIYIDSDPSALEGMLQKSNGMRTVPQIFIGDHHVGGCDDLYALESEGKLDDMLKG